MSLRQLTPQAVLFILEKRGAEAGVTNFSAHDFRRTFISELLDNTDIVTVQKLAVMPHQNSLLDMIAGVRKFNNGLYRQLVFPNVVNFTA